MESESSSKVIVLANGCWDLLHAGHLRHLLQARSMGTELWVSVTDDLHVLKGPGRPIYKQEDRLALIKGLRCVDKAFTCSGLIEALEFAMPSVLVKGVDYKGGLAEVHEKWCRNHGIEIRYTTTEKYSATQIIHELRDRK